VTPYIRDKGALPWQPILGLKLLQMHIAYTVSQKRLTCMACYNFDTHEQILIFFGRTVTDKVQAIKRCFNMPLQIICASALPGKTGKHENHIFHSNAVLLVADG